jgi:hypothetical protein
VEAVYEYPRDARDGWEPGAPSPRAMAPSVVGGAVIPLCVYFLVRGFVGSDAIALAIAGIPAAAWVGFEWLRRGRIDPIGAIVLFGFIGGLAVSFAMGGSAFILKVRDSAFTFLFGIACLVSLATGKRTIIFHIGRALSAGDDPIRARLYDDLWDIPPARAAFRRITVVWSFALVAEATVRVLLAASLPTGAFLAAAPVNSAVFIGGAFAFTIWYSRWSRERASAQLAGARAPAAQLAPDQLPAEPIDRRSTGD